MSAQPKTDEAKPAAEVQQADENPMRKFDAPVLKAIGSDALVSPGVTQFLPSNMGEAMEFAKLMASSNFVPPHLRGVPGDCLAVIMQSTRWGADPYAVANKTYFVNNRMAFEAQLVAAVVNTSNVLQGRLKVEWDGTGENMICKVRGHIKGEPDELIVWQEMKTITTRNSPLWKSSQRQQLGYHTMRQWARLYTPEVLLGIYTPDELEAEEVMNPKPGTQQVIPPRPSRQEIKAEVEASRKADKNMDRQFRDTMREETRPGDQDRAQAQDIAQQTAHDAETGEIEDEENGQSQPVPGTSAATGQEAGGGSEGRPQPSNTVDYDELAGRLITKFKSASTRKALDNLVGVVYAQDLDLLRTDAPELSARVQAEVKTKQAWFAR